MTAKPCKKCGATEKYFGRCHPCTKERSRKLKQTPRHKTRAAEYYQKNKARMSEWMREHRKKPEVKARAFELYLLDKYGIDTHDWALIYERQGGICPGCLNNLGFGRHVHIDHCHNTRRVRGLLCHWCNTGLGAFRENIAAFNRLSQYLLAYQQPAEQQPEATP